MDYVKVECGPMPNVMAAKPSYRFHLRLVFLQSSTKFPSGNSDKNSSGDEIANVNFYAVRPEGTRIR